MKSISLKMLTIMRECQYLQKQGVNEFHNYKFVQANDVIKAVRDSLVKNGVSLTVNYKVVFHAKNINKSGKEETQTTVKARITFIDTESGETLTSAALGMGQDIGDKSIMKAETAAYKYCLLHTFAIGTGDDPEEDAEVDERMGAERQRKAPYINVPPKQSVDPPIQLKVPESSSQEPKKCSGCGRAIDSKVLDYSTRIFKRPLCMSCQMKNQATSS